MASLNLNPTGTSDAQFVHAVDSASLSVIGDLTLECWVKLGTLASELGANQTFVNKDVNNGNISWRFLQNSTNDKLVFAISSTGTTGSALGGGTSNTALAKDIWTHVAVAYYSAGGTALFYKDGAIDGTYSGGTINSIYDGTAPLQIGAANGLVAPADYTVGLVDEVRLWNTTRTGAEISTNYKKELVGNEGGLQAYYKLNNVLTDSTANANNLTAVNAPTFSDNVPFGGASGLQSKYW